MKASLYSLILRLVSYGLNTGLIEKEDTIYTINQLLDLYKMDEPDDSNAELTDDSESNLEEILSGLLKNSKLNMKLLHKEIEISQLALEKKFKKVKMA